MSFTVEDYQITAAVARANSNESLALKCDAEINTLQARDEYAKKLGVQIYDTRKDAWHIQGWLLIARLIDDGWTPPEELF